ncbi:MAG TPA: ZIP family metal transporter [Phycisphaerae bacterium]|nr:ZIP family metal transporter [Phycisphaerae bacterium]
MIYAFIVAAVCLIGAAVPLRKQPTHAHLQIYLSAAAGALLGAALFHLLPESSEYIGGGFGLPAAIGIVAIFLLQRYLAPHSHEPAELALSEDEHHHPHDHDHGHPHDHDHGAHTHGHQTHAAPALGNMIAILALSIHSFLDGVAIGAVASMAGTAGTAVGVSVFLSVLIHKPMDGLSVSVLLLNARVKRSRLWLIQCVYAGLVPLGAWAFMLTRGAISEAMEGPVLGYTLAFSAGTFASIALTDLLPELHFHRHDRNKLSAAMLLTMAVMYVAHVLGHAGHAHAH